MAVDATPGGANADTYIDVADADAYHANHLYASVWTAATTPNKESALKMATRLLDQLVQWNGSKATQTQALRWPRLNVLDVDGYLLSESAIPLFLQRATAEFARLLLTSDRTAEPGTAGLASLKAGPIDLAFDKTDRVKVIPDSVRAFIKYYGDVQGYNPCIALRRG